MLNKENINLYIKKKTVRGLHYNDININSILTPIKSEKKYATYSINGKFYTINPIMLLLMYSYLAGKLKGLEHFCSASALVR